MVLPLLYKDELNGFYKSSVMMVLWVGLPLISVVSYLFLPDMDDGTPISYLTSTIISSLGGFLAAMMLAVYIIHEKSHHVYDLFLIRPVKKRDILLSKFLAVFTCVAVASVFALTLSFLLDYLVIRKYPDRLFTDTLRSFLISLSLISIECAAGAFVGVLVSSVLVGVVSVVLTHNIAALTIITPILMKSGNTVTIVTITGISLTALFLILAIQIFKRKQ